MLLGDVAAASADVTATSSRLAKVARIAELLGSTTDAAAGDDRGVLAVR